MEAELIAALGAGRSYVREALSRLEYDGLVEKNSGCSSVVRYVPKSELLEILDARISLEAIAVRAAALSRTAQQAVRMRDLAKEIEVAADQGDLGAVTRAQAAFHHALLEASGLPAIRRMISNLTALTAQTRSRTMLLPGRVRTSASDHRAVAKAILAGDPETAERAMIHHLVGVKNAIGQLPSTAMRPLRLAASRRSSA